MVLPSNTIDLLSNTIDLPSNTSDVLAFVLSQEGC